jgi:hypothetical protein
MSEEQIRKVIDDLKVADRLLGTDGYESWAFPREVISEAINVLSLPLPVESWISVKEDTKYDGTYLGFIEKHEVCGVINYYQRTVTNRKNKWVLEEGESLLFWQKLGANPINTNS